MGVITGGSFRSNTVMLKEHATQLCGSGRLKPPLKLPARVRFALWLEMLWYDPLNVPLSSPVKSLLNVPLKYSPVPMISQERARTERFPYGSVGVQFSSPL